MSDLPSRTIVHMDLDSFYVSVECLRDPSLKGKAIIIGMDSVRGVVASCSYEARKFGVHSAMPSKQAKQLCPHAVFIPPAMEKYSEYSALVRKVIAGSAPVFEQASIDEFYLDISGMDKFFGCFKWTNELREKIIKETGLPISFGMSSNKMVSKIATGESKPNGYKQILPGTEREFLAPLPIGKMPGIGEKTEAALKRINLITLGDVAAMKPELMEEAFGSGGRSLWERANGIDSTPLYPDAERKSISTEHTFVDDTRDEKFLKRLIIKMVEELSFSIRKEEKLAGCVTIKIKYADFEVKTMQRSILYTSSDQILFKNAIELFDELYSRRKAIRLLGVRFSNFVRGSRQIDLFEDTGKSISLYQAMDKIRFKFGEDKVGRAIE
jgi:DNA polymerase IV